MRQTAFVLAGLAAVSIALVGCDVQKTQEGNVSVPKYDVSKTKEGDVTLPKYDVTAPSVDVSTVGVYTEKETLTVPKVDVKTADEKKAEQGKK
jgi:hypothetical protein